MFQIAMPEKKYRPMGEFTPSSAGEELTPPLCQAVPGRVVRLVPQVLNREDPSERREEAA